MIEINGTSLYYNGRKEIINIEERAAVVGRRKGSRTELIIAERIGKELARLEYTVVSGFAKGVDRAAQLGALKADGYSISVLPQGFNQSYMPPAYTSYLNKRLLEVSAYPPDTPFSGKRAMDRNKIIFDLSEIVFVVASGLGRDGKGTGSGTFQGANIAIKKGKEVYVVDPNVYVASGVPVPVGNDKLIELGANTISHTSEIESLIGLI